MSEKEIEEGNLGISLPGQEDDDVLSLMIVDDEFLVRIGIRETIPWGEHGFLIAGEAENGEEGLELAKRIQPDIIITDIRMPNMDGLEFMSRLKEEGIDAKVIVLSGYDEFDYAREALKYGALAYLLKPIENHQLLETVRNAGQTIIKERELKRRYSDLEQEVSSIVRHQLIRAIEGVPVTLSADDLKRINFPLQENKIIILIRIDDYELLRIQNLENLGIVTQVISTMDAKIDGIRRSIILEKNKDEWVIIIDLEQYNNMEIIYSLCQDILRLIYQCSELTRDEMTFSIGISNPFLDVMELSRAYNEALQASRYKLIPRTNSINHINEINSADRQEYLQRAIMILKDNYHKAITVETVANNLSLSPSYLMHLFKSKLGKTFGECLMDFRISVAKELLQEPSYRIYEIAERVGYKDPKYFSQIFKKVTGFTPKEYSKIPLKRC